METGVSGYVDFTATKGFTLRVYYSETYDETAETSDATITKIQVKGDTYYGFSCYLDGTIKVNGTTAVTMSSNQGSHHVAINGKSTFYDVGGTLGSVSGIAHNADGSKSVAIAVSVTGYVPSSSSANAWTVTSESTVALTTFLVGLVYIDNGSSFDAYQCYIDNGSSWDLYIPYIDSGSSWDLLA